jgi:hypothetical protein
MLVAITSMLRVIGVWIPLMVLPGSEATAARDTF